MNTTAKFVKVTAKVCERHGKSFWKPTAKVCENHGKSLWTPRQMFVKVTAKVCESHGKSVWTPRQKFVKATANACESRRKRKELSYQFSSQKWSRAFSRHLLRFIHSIVSRGDWLWKPANFKVISLWFSRSHVTMTLHTQISNMAFLRVEIYLIFSLFSF